MPYKLHCRTIENYAPVQAGAHFALLGGSSNQPLFEACLGTLSFPTFLVPLAPLLAALGCQRCPRGSRWAPELEPKSSKVQLWTPVPHLPCLSVATWCPQAQKTPPKWYQPGSKTVTKSTKTAMNYWVTTVGRSTTEQKQDIIICPPGACQAHSVLSASPLVYPLQHGVIRRRSKESIYIYIYRRRNLFPTTA